MNNKRLVFKRFTKRDINSVEKFCYDALENKIASNVRNYLEQPIGRNWIGYGLYIGRKLISCCFIKQPSFRPETTTITAINERNKGWATYLRNYAIEQREFKGNIIYSAVRHNNFSSLKSLIKSGFQVFDITKDGHIQLIKILSYKKRADD